MQIQQMVNEDGVRKRVVMTRITELYKRKRLDDWGIKVALEQYWERFPADEKDNAFGPKQATEAEWLEEKIKNRPDLPQEICGKATGIPAPVKYKPVDQQRGPIGDEVEKLASDAADVIFTPILEILESVGIPAKTIKVSVKFAYPCPGLGDPGSVVTCYCRRGCDKDQGKPSENMEVLPSTTELHDNTAALPPQRCTATLHHSTAPHYCTTMACNALQL